jgi:endonuclease
MLNSPSLGDAHAALVTSLESRMMIVIVASCEVHYSGRTGSHLGEGQRLIIIKEDGCVLIHRSADYRPVNWQPGGGIVQAQLSKDRLVVRAVRPSPLESLNISINTVDLFASFRLLDEAEFQLHASEEDMQKAIVYQPSIIEAGLEVVEYERHVEPGFVDIYAVDRKGNSVVIEIKKDPAGVSAVKQLAEYLKYIQPKPGRKLRPIIVAPSLAKGAQTLISKMGFEYKQLSLQKCVEVLRRQAVSERQQMLKGWLPE